MKDDFCWGLEERTNWVYNDLKAFQYVRLNNLQHGKDDIGGGNMSMATLLFIMLSLYSKINYFIERPDKFREDGTVNEQEAFIKFAKQLKAAGIITSLPENGEALSLMWTGFRDRLVHRMTIENGKSAAAFKFSTVSPTITLKSLMEIYLDKEVFVHDGNQRNWVVNCDPLHAKLPELCKFVTSKLKDHDEVDIQRLRNYVG